MLKKYSPLLLSMLLVLAPFTRSMNAQEQQRITLDQLKVEIAKVGVGEKARATITTRDGAKIKGYISKAGEDDFVVRDRKTDAPTTIRYTDIARVERNRGHSTARNVFLGVGIGAGALLATILIVIARAD